MTRHIVVIGLMGSGKTTLGRLLADRLGRPYRDSDIDIENAAGLTGREIAARDGVDRLHELEASVLTTALAEDHPLVITAAGSTVESPTAVVAIERRSFAVWLDATPELVQRRLASGAHRRPMDLHETVTLHNRRAPMFRDLADLVVDAAAEPESQVQDVLRAFETFDTPCGHERGESGQNG